MKLTTPLKGRGRSIPVTALCVCVVLAGSSPLLFAAEVPAGKTEAPAAPEEETFNNWVELGIGGIIFKGNRAEGQRRLGMSDDQFGGITDMHLEQALGKKWLAKLDGHAIFNNNDYDLTLDVSNPDIGYVRAGFKEFRTYYNGMGGFYPNEALPGDGQMFTPNNDELSLDRGDVWVELGLRMASLPEITLRYEHMWRHGVKDSTMWGDTNLTGANLLTNNTRKIVPAFHNINERRDIFTADVKKTIGITDVGVGARWEHVSNDDSLNTIFRPGEYNPNILYSDVKLDRYLTQHDTLKSDMFSTHATTETRFNEKFWLTTSYSYLTLNSDIGGNRIYGPSFDSPYLPMYGVSRTRNSLDPSLPLAATASGKGYIDLIGGSEMDQHEFNVNLMWMPIPQISILTGFRFDKSETDSVTEFTETNMNTSAKAYYTVVTMKNGVPVKSTKSVTYLQPTQEPWYSRTAYTLQKMAQTLEVRFTGLKDCVLYARGDWDEDNQNIEEIQKRGLLIQQYQLDPNKTTPTLVPTIRTPGAITSGTANIVEDTFWDGRRMTQKYTAGFNWYPFQKLSFSAQYYHKIDQNDYNNPNLDGYIYSQDFKTDDVNFRITARPFSNLSMVSRYDFQRMQSFTSAETLGPDDRVLESFGPENSATATSHMFSECVTWNPLDRLYFQANFCYVMSKTNTKASITIQDPTYYSSIDPNTGLPVTTYTDGNRLIGPVGLSFKNNYWTAGLGAGFAFDDKTEIHLDYTCYRANNYGNNDMFGHDVVIGQPYGSGAEEHTVSASIDRQLSRNARLTLKYAFYSSRDETSYGQGNFSGHLLFTGLQVRF